MRVYGLLGKTLKHSFSQKYFTEKFSASGLNDCRYENFELEKIGQLPDLLKGNEHIKGLNVTIPYKEDVLSFLNYQNEIVKEVKACNCIKVLNGELYGFNTDVLGFKHSLQKNLEPQHTHALILGTGGSAKAVQYALKNLGILYQNVSRTKTTNTITYEMIDETILSTHKLIINTSPLGMYPNLEEFPPIPYHLLTGSHLLFDLIYNPEKTLFLKMAEERGAKICNGQEMLIIQAEESWRIWND